MLSQFLPLCLLVVATVAAYGGATACPWVTQGTAAKALGGEVSLTMNVSEAGEGSCDFRRVQEPSAFLKIEVSKTALPTCSSDSTKLKGIGNEATRCKLSGSASQYAEMISSRVRDRYFTVTLDPTAKRDSAKSADAQDDALEQIAETFAGSLFQKRPERVESSKRDQHAQATSAS